jgi:hypothetical protein
MDEQAEAAAAAMSPSGTQLRDPKYDRYKKFDVSSRTKMECKRHWSCAHSLHSLIPFAHALFGFSVSAVLAVV